MNSAFVSHHHRRVISWLEYSMASETGVEFEFLLGTLVCEQASPSSPASAVIARYCHRPIFLNTTQVKINMHTDILTLLCNCV